MEKENKLKSLMTAVRKGGLKKDATSYYGKNYTALPKLNEFLTPILEELGLAFFFEVVDAVHCGDIKTKETKDIKVVETSLSRVEKKGKLSLVDLDTNEVIRETFSYFTQERTAKPSDNHLQNFGAGTTYAHRIMLTSFLGFPGEKDNDGESDEQISGRTQTTKTAKPSGLRVKITEAYKKKNGKNVSMEDALKICETLLSVNKISSRDEITDEMIATYFKGAK